MSSRSLWSTWKNRVLKYGYLKWYIWDVSDTTRLHVSNYWGEKWMQHVQWKERSCAHTKKDVSLKWPPRGGVHMLFISDPHLAWHTKITEPIFIEWVTGYEWMKTQPDLSLQGLHGIQWSRNYKKGWPEWWLQVWKLKPHSGNKSLYQCACQITLAEVGGSRLESEQRGAWMPGRKFI